MSSGHRLHCIYSTEREGAMADQPSLGLLARGMQATSREPIEHITPGEFLRRCGDPAPTDRMEDHYLRAERQMPLLLGEHVAESFAFAAESGSAGEPADGLGEARPGVSSPRLSAFRLPYGGLVFCLTLKLDGDLADVVDLLHRTTFQWRSIRLDGKALEHCAAHIPAAAPELGSAILGTDVHHLLSVDPDQIAIFTEANESPSEPSVHPEGVDPHTVEALVFRTLQPIRSSYGELRYPKAANRHNNALVAAGPYVTVMCSPHRELEGWLLWSVLQLTCALARLRQVRSDAYDVLYDMEQELAATSGAAGRLSDVRAQHALARARIAGLSHRLGRLEQELAFGVVAYLDTQFVLPSAMLAHSHRALTELMGLESGTQSTSELLERATRTVDARYDALGALERSVDQARQRRLDTVVAAITATALLMAIFFGFFGSNASPISDEHRPFFHIDYVWFYGALIAMAGGSYLLIMAALRRLPRRESPADWTDWPADVS